MQIHRPAGSRLEQRLPGPEVVRRGARGHAGAAVDLPMRQTPDAVVAQDVDRGVENLRPSSKVGGHQFLYCSFPDDVGAVVVQWRLQ